MAEATPRKRVWSAQELTEKGGFAPFHEDEFPGAFVKSLVGEQAALHDIQLAVLEPKAQRVHSHEGAETIFVILEGEGEYFYFREQGVTQQVKAGDVVHALPAEVNGLRNTGTGPLRYLVVVGTFNRPVPGSDA